MPTRKFSTDLGARQVTEAAGTVIPGGDGIEVNVDATRMSRLDFVQLLERVIAHVIQGRWPPA